MRNNRVSPEALGLINVDKVAPLAVQVLDVVQLHDAEKQVTSIALAFMLCCERLDVHPGNVMNTAERILIECKHKSAELRALRQYMKEEYNA